MEGQGGLRLPVEGKPGGALPGVIRLTREGPALGTLHGAPQVQVDEESLLPLPIGVAADGGQQPGHVGRAAGTGVPRGTLGVHMALGGRFAGDARHHFQGVAVEEALAVQLHPRQHRVVQGPLHHVGVLALGLQLEHPPGKEDQPDGGAGLRVDGGVGQVVIHGEGLSQHGGANAPGDVHLPVGDALPQGAAGLGKALVPGLPGQVRHGRVQVHRPHGVAHGVLLLPHGEGALGVVGIVGVVAGGAPHVPAPAGLFLDKVVGGLTPHL